MALNKRVHILIKHNPYIRETFVNVEYRKLSSRNLLNEIAVCAPVTEWADRLDSLLQKQYGNRRIFLSFCGTEEDFRILQQALPHGDKSRESRIKLRHDNILQRIKKPVAGQVSVPARSAPRETGKAVRKRDLEICVIATMSSGKSTLINAILGTKLMPATQEACTAIIVRIRDEDSFKGQGFWGEAKGHGGEVIERMDDLTLERMSVLNTRSDISQVEIVGDIECVPSEDVSLVLVDTPGPNNARNENHRQVQQQQLSKMSDAIVLFVMTGEFGNDDEFALLQHVVKTIAEGSQRDKDRFLFVLNKVDARHAEDGALEDTLKDLKGYLQSHGIQEPRIFPVSALLGLELRRIMNCDPSLTEDDLDEIEVKIRKFNRTPQLHLEKYAAEFSGLPGDIAEGLETSARLAENIWLAKGGAKYGSPGAAFIHSGIPALEAVFKEYVEKYGKNGN